MVFSFEIFEEVFDFDTSNSYDESRIGRTLNNRQKYEGLFVDLLMKTMGIKRPVKYYPPKSDTDLQLLHKAIVESKAADHSKLSALYYTLLDFDEPTKGGNYSAALEKKSFLPQKYQIFVRGLWYLDCQNYDAAVQHLTHPSLVPTFANEIIEHLVKNAKGNNMTLPLAYYHTVQPALTSLKAVESLLSAIVRTSVTEGFYFNRTQSELARRHMFELLIALVLNNSPSSTVAERSVELVSLPFDAVEEAWFEEYLLRGEGRAIRRGKDTVMMRRLGTAQFAESLVQPNLGSGRSLEGLDWEKLAAAVRGGLGPRVP